VVRPCARHLQRFLKIVLAHDGALLEVGERTRQPSGAMEIEQRPAQASAMAA
jgi:hypothetical protein